MAGALAVLRRVLAPAQAEEAGQLLDDRELDKLALMAGEIESVVSSAVLKPLQSDKEEAVLVELSSRATVAVKELEILRRSRVDPLNAEVKNVNALFRVVTDPLTPLTEKNGQAERLILAYRAAKRARIERERQEAERKQREAAEREAAARAKAEAAKTDKARQKALAEAEAASQQQMVAAIEAPREMTRGVRTDSGLVSDREEWVLHAISSLEAVPEQYWHDPTVLEALDKVLRRAVRSGVHEIPGCVIGPEDRLTRRVG